MTASRLDAGPCDLRTQHSVDPSSQRLRRQWKHRWSPAGLHLFDRTTGLNILLDEVPVPADSWSRAPRQVSIALTNRCDLACGHCYAPKSRDELSYESVTRWISEFDAHGALGVGFGGGEPTLYPRFVELCHHATHGTHLSVTFTTHAHHIDEEMADALRGNIHFIRVSMDGVGATYEAIRRRSFQELLVRMRRVRTISEYGVNIVVNERTLPDLHEAAAIAADLGASELLLLPQMPTPRCLRADVGTLSRLQEWVAFYRGPLKLSINEGFSEGFPTCDPVAKEGGLRAYAHIDAAGVLKPNSYSASGVHIAEEGALSALDQLAHTLEENDL